MTEPTECTNFFLPSGNESATWLREGSIDSAKIEAYSRAEGYGAEAALEITALQS